MAARRPTPSPEVLNERLLALRAEWHDRRLDSDPLEFAHRYGAAADREVVAFVAAALAFGRVASIRASLERALAPLGGAPARFLRGRAAEGSKGPVPGLEDFTHRWVRPADLQRFFAAIGRTLEAEGSLEGLYRACSAEAEGGARTGTKTRAGTRPANGDAVEVLDRFFAVLRERAAGRGRTPSRGLRFLLPSPAGGSACKRAHLFLRWVVRSDGFDLGLWAPSTLPASRLLLPMDVHVHRISRRLGLTRRRTADLAAAREATRRLAEIDPHDPVSFDWALSRLGIVAGCVLTPLPETCRVCPVLPACREPGVRPGLLGYRGR